MSIKTEMFIIGKSQESKISIDQEAREETTPIVLETPDTQDSKNDKVLPIMSSEKLKSPERNVCGNIILEETHVNCIKEYLWITPKPASFFEEYFESLPKGPKS